MACHHDREFWNEFLNLYRSFPYLWWDNPDIMANRENYRHERAKANNKLLEYCLERYPNADAAFVQKKVHNFRCGFQREYRKKKHLEATGKQHEPVLWYYKKLLFLVDEDNDLDLHEEENFNVKMYGKQYPSKKKLKSISDCSTNEHEDCTESSSCNEKSILPSDIVKTEFSETHMEQPIDFLDNSINFDDNKLAASSPSQSQSSLPSPLLIETDALTTTTESNKLPLIIPTTVSFSTTATTSSTISYPVSPLNSLNLYEHQGLKKVVPKIATKILEKIYLTKLPKINELTRRKKIPISTCTTTAATTTTSSTTPSTKTSILIITTTESKLSTSTCTAPTTTTATATKTCTTETTTSDNNLPKLSIISDANITYVEGKKRPAAVTTTTDLLSNKKQVKKQKMQDLYQLANRAVCGFEKLSSDLVQSYENHSVLDSCTLSGKKIANDLREMEQTQRYLAEKLISEVIFNGKMNLLTTKYIFKPSL